MVSGMGTAGDGSIQVRSDVHLASFLPLVAL